MKPMKAREIAEALTGFDPDAEVFMVVTEGIQQPLDGEEGYWGCPIYDVALVGVKGDGYIMLDGENCPDGIQVQTMTFEEAFPPETLHDVMDEIQRIEDDKSE